MIFMNESLMKTIFKKGEDMKTNVTRTAAKAASAGLAAMALLAASCSKDGVGAPDTGAGEDRGVTVRASVAGYYGEDHSAGADNVVRDLQACIFEGGRMTEIFDNLSLSEGSCDLSIDGHSGTLYMLANTDGLIDLAALQTEDISEAEWLKTAVSMKDGAPADFFSGSVSLDGMDKSQTRIPLSLRRGIARFDLKFNTAGAAEVYRVTLRNAAGSAFLFPVSGQYSPEDVSRKDYSAEFRDQPLTADTEGVLHVYEQSTGDRVVISVDAVMDGKTEVLTKELTEPLKRNTVYTLTVRKDTIDVSLEVTFDEWEPGGDTELVP